MPFRKINADEFVEESTQKIRRVKLSDLRAELSNNQQGLSGINKRIKYFKDIFAQSKYPDDVRRFLSTLKEEREMHVEGVAETESLIDKLEKM